MLTFLKQYWKTLAFFGVVGLVGGYFVGIYQLDSFPEEMRQEILSQGLTPMLLGLVTALQSAGYGLVLGAAGIWLGKQTGLWKDQRHLDKKPLLITLAAAVLGGLALILPDLLVFGRYSQPILDSYAVKPSISYLVASVTYGGIIEEVMLRLFMMSLIAFILHKFFEKREKPGIALLVVANIIAALLFAAAHLPATFVLIGNSPLIIFRCFLLNGGFGLLFGWLYRKYGLRYAMIAHGGCHVVSKLIWILFV